MRRQTAGASFGRAAKTCVRANQAEITAPMGTGGWGVRLMLPLGHAEERKSSPIGALKTLSIRLSVSPRFRLCPSNPQVYCGLR